MNAHVEVLGAHRAVVGSLVNLLPYLAAIAKSTAAPVDLSANPAPVALLPPPAAVEPEPVEMAPVELPKPAGPDFEAAGIAAGGRLIKHADGRFRAERTGDDAVSSDWQNTVRAAWQQFCRKAGLTFEPGAATFTASLDCAAFTGATVKACRVIEKRTNIPILGCLLMRYHPDGLEIVGTDLDRRVSVIIPGNVDRLFRATVDAHLVKNLLRKCPDGQITFTVTESTDKAGNVESAIRLQHEKGMNSSLMGRDPEDFPVIAEPTFAASVTMPAARLAKAFGEVEYAISSEETRYYLNGVYWHSANGILTMVATDGHRLAKHELPEIAAPAAMPNVIIPVATVDTVGFTIPSKPARKRKGSADAEPARKRKGSADAEPAMVTVHIGATTMRFVSGNVVLDSKLIDGSFPDYARVIPSQNDKTMRVNAAMLADTVDRLAAMQSERGRSAKLEIGADRVLVSIANPDSGIVSESVSCQFDGDGAFVIGFNSDYMRHLLARITGDAAFKLADPGCPVLIEGGDSLHVLMPMRV